MGLFKNNKTRKVGAWDEARLATQAQKISERILAVQRTLAAKLNTQAQKMGKKNTLFILGALVIGLGVYCAWLVIGAFF